MNEFNWLRTLAAASGIGATLWMGSMSLAQAPANQFRPAPSPEAPVPGLGERIQAAPDAPRENANAPRVNAPRTETRKVEARQSATRPIASLRGSQLIGMQLHDSAGNPIGAVQDFVLDANGNVAYVTAGFTGRGFANDWSYVMPFHAVTFRNGDTTGTMNAQIALDRERLLKAPAFRTAEWPDFTNRQVLGSVQEFWQGAGTLGAGINDGRTGIESPALDRRADNTRGPARVEGAGGVNSAVVPGSGTPLPGTTTPLPAVGSGGVTGNNGTVTGPGVTGTPTAPGSVAGTPTAPASVAGTPTAPGSVAGTPTAPGSVAGAGAGTGASGTGTSGAAGVGISGTGGAGGASASGTGTTGTGAGAPSTSGAAGTGGATGSGGAAGSGGATGSGGAGGSGT